MTETSDLSPVAAAELLCDQAVLRLLLENYPVPFTRDEISRELATEPIDFAGQDLIDNSLRDLAGYGLIYRHGDFFLATRAAKHAARLV